MKIISLSLKLILIISILTAIYSQLWHIATTNTFLLILTFTPQILKKSVNIKFPKKLELAILVLVIITFILGGINIVLAPILFGIGTGLIALLILFIMQSANNMKKSNFLILTYAFSFSMTFGALLEIAKYYLKIILSHTISKGVYTIAITNLTYVLLGSLIACVIGYMYMKSHFTCFEKIVEVTRKKNPELLGKEHLIKATIEEIKKGETPKQEFKSTLRVNLHTKKQDKNIEHSILKTIAAFLNTKGGTLYIGVTDDGKILGIEKDGFENNDKFHLHLTNLIKNKLGKANKVSTQIIQLKDRHIAKVKVNKSKQPVFLKTEKGEKFFVRSGPQTHELAGSELLQYAKEHFEKKK